MKQERQKRHQESELADLQKELSSKFSALKGRPELFTLSDVLDSEPRLDEHLKSVSLEKKRLLLPLLLKEYQAENPDSKNVPFRWIKSRLEENYGVKCKSISNFFLGILDEYELAGGNRNRSVLLK